MADHDDEKPLDPALLQVQAKLRRLMLIAGGTLFIGLLAVLSWPSSSASPARDGRGRRAPDRDADQSRRGRRYPAVARLVSTAISDGRIALAYEYPGGTALIMVDPEWLEIVGRLDRSRRLAARTSEP